MSNFIASSKNIFLGGNFLQLGGWVQVRNHHLLGAVASSGPAIILSVGEILGPIFEVLGAAVFSLSLSLTIHPVPALRKHTA